MTRWKVLGRLAVGKANPAEDRAKAAHRHAYSYSLYLFNPGKMMLVPRLFSAGQKRETAGSMNALTSLRHREGYQGVKAPLDQPTAILATNSKMGNIFLHNAQAIDLLRESPGWLRAELWKNEPIEAFVMVAQR
jgi:hypothetical protein